MTTYPVCDIRDCPCVGTAHPPLSTDALTASYGGGDLTIECLTHPATDEDPPQVIVTFEIGVDGAIILYIDTPDFEPTPDRLRVNVNDGGVFNYPDATRWYGDDKGEPAPEWAADRVRATKGTPP